MYIYVLFQADSRVTRPANVERFRHSLMHSTTMLTPSWSLTDWKTNPVKVLDSLTQLHCRNRTLWNLRFPGKAHACATQKLNSYPGNGRCSWVAYNVTQLWFGHGCFRCPFHPAKDTSGYAIRADISVFARLVSFAQPTTTGMMPITCSSPLLRALRYPFLANECQRSKSDRPCPC